MVAAAARESGEADAALPHGAGLCAFLDATAAREPGRIAFTEQADRAAWSGRPPITWTYGVAREIVGRLAEGLRRLGLPPRSPVGLCMAGGAEHALALMAIEEAGHLPCLIPVGWDEDRLGLAIDAAKIAMVITQGRLGEARPAEALCRVAARTFGLRFVAAFGPQVPDGVIGLDEIVLEVPARGPVGFAEPAGIVTFGGDPTRPVYRSADALVAATAGHLVAARIESGERVLSLVAPVDLKGLVTGLAAALLAGASLEAHGLFSGSALSAALAREEPTHLVVPGWMEPALTGAAAPTLRSITFVHRAPLILPERGEADGAVLDALSLDEDALVTRRRAGGDDLGAALAGTGAGTGGLLRLRRGPDGVLSYRGPATAAEPFSRGATSTPGGGTWRASRYRVDMFAGFPTGLSPI
jgi:mycobactin salicyl-AMP ligase